MMKCYVLTCGCRCAYRICFFSFLIAAVFEGVLHLAHSALRHIANTHGTSCTHCHDLTAIFLSRSARLQ